MAKKPSSHDVADLAGVSRWTVTQALNRNMKARIPQETRERVLQAARKLNYVPSTVGRALVTGKTGRIGIATYAPANFSGADDDAYYSNVMKGLVAEAVAHRTDLVLHTVPPEDPERMFAHVVNGASDGVVLLGYQDSNRLPQMLTDRGFPYVCVGFHPEGVSATIVDGDNRQGGRLAAEALLAAGCRRAVMMGNQNNRWQRDRFEAFQESFAPIGEVVGQFGEPIFSNSQDLFAMLTRLTEGATGPLGVFIHHDWRAIQFTELLANSDFDFPGKLKIVAYTSTERFEFTQPKLTGVRIPLKELGQVAYRTLTERIENPGLPHTEVILPVSMEYRESC